MTIILLEGPDGSGKDTTLAAMRKWRLDIVPYERACTSDGGPVDDLAGWVDEHMIKLERYRWRDGPHTVLNRHPLVSELVYGPICRGALAPKFDNGNWLHSRLHRFAGMGVRVWYHLPPTYTIEPYLDTPGRVDMPGVEQNIYAIHAAYRVMRSVLPFHRYFIHDYTSDPNHTIFMPLLEMEAPINGAVPTP